MTKFSNACGILYVWKLISRRNVSVVFTIDNTDNEKNVKSRLSN